MEDPDDWDTGDKNYMWLPSYEGRSPNFDVYRSNGMIIMKIGTPPGSYSLTFNVSTTSYNIDNFHQNFQKIFKNALKQHFGIPKLRATLNQ